MLGSQFPQPGPVHRGPPRNKCCRYGLASTNYLLADLREAAFANGTFVDGTFANGSRGPTWVTYAPTTSLPLTTPLSVCSPAFEPSFQVRAALPLASLTARVGVTVPDFTEKLTFASGTGLP